MQACVQEQQSPTWLLICAHDQLLLWRKADAIYMRVSNIDFSTSISMRIASFSPGFPSVRMISCCSGAKLIRYSSVAPAMDARLGVRRALTSMSCPGAFGPSGLALRLQKQQHRKKDVRMATSMSRPDAYEPSGLALKLQTQQQKQQQQQWMPNWV
jgi:hypothetical protein